MFTGKWWATIALWSFSVICMLVINIGYVCLFNSVLYNRHSQYFRFELQRLGICSNAVNIDGKWWHVRSKIQESNLQWNQKYEFIFFDLSQVFELHLDNFKAIGSSIYYFTVWVRMIAVSSFLYIKLQKLSSFNERYFCTDQIITLNMSIFPEYWRLDLKWSQWANQKDALSAL